MPSSSRQIFNFNHIATQLRLIERFKGLQYWRHYPPQGRWESVSDHSWRLSLLVMLFVDQLSQPFEPVKAYKMALIHDLPEILHGDDSPMGESGTGADSHAYNSKLWAERHHSEKSAAREIFSQLSSSQATELFDLWVELEQNHTFEARVVKSLDKIDAMTHVLEMQKGHMFPEHLEFTIKYGQRGADVDPAIADYADFVVVELQRRFKPFQP